MIIFLTVITSIVKPELVDMYRNLSISAWNLRCNANIAGPYINNLLRHSNFIALSEHGLFECELYKLGKYNDELDFIAKADINLSDKDFRHRRGHGGCALLWNKDISAHVRPLPNMGSNRMCVVEFTNGTFKCYIISVYLPYEGCRTAEFLTELNILETVITECRKDGETLIIGDMNSNIASGDYGLRGWTKTNVNGKHLMSFSNRNSLNIIDLMRGEGPSWTFQNPLGMSYIDHVLVSEGLLSLINSCHVFPDVVANVSDHLVINVSINAFYVPISNVKKQKRVAWSKLTKDNITEWYTGPIENLIENLINKYQINVTDALNGYSEYYQTSENGFDIDRFVRELTTCLHLATSNLPKTRYSKAAKPYWDKELTELSKYRKIAKREWDSIGNPKDEENPALKKYKECKRNYRKKLRQNQFEYEKQEMLDLSQNEEMNQHFFWHLVKKHRKSTNCVTPIKNDEGITLTNPTDIRNDWNKYYEKLYSNTNENDYDDVFKITIENELKEIYANLKLTGKLKDGIIKVEEVREQINKLKLKKAAGWDDVTAEQIKYLGNIGVGTITWLMNVMVQLKHIPQVLKRGLIVPIPKPGKDSSIKDKNRGITLLPVIYKLFEMVILNRERKWLNANNKISELQGAAQQHCSSVHVSLLLQESINYNRNKGENVYVAFLDIRKAFDTVWISGLLHKLFKMGMDPEAVMLIRESFTNFQCTTYISGKKSTWFEPNRGVHQGAPLSMTLYEIYINDLLQQLKSCEFGLRLRELNVSSPTFADDISAGTISKPGLNKMMCIADQYRQKWRFDFSQEKCVYMVWGTDAMPDLPVKLGSFELKHVTCNKHMGITLTSQRNTSLIVSEMIGKARQSLYVARGLGSSSVPVTPRVLSKIYNSVSMCKMIYGVEATFVSESDVKELEQAHRQHARLIQSLPINAPNAAVLAPLGWLSIKAQIAIKKLIFLWKIITLETGNI